MGKILIIDDDRLICACLAEVAVMVGHETRLAQDGNTGSQIALEFQPDLVFVDLLMPGRAGLETLVALRREIPSARLIAMTGQPIIGDVSLLELARKFGADGVLAKPFRVAEVADLITTYLPG